MPESTEDQLYAVDPHYPTIIREDGSPVVYGTPTKLDGIPNADELVERGVLFAITKPSAEAVAEAKAAGEGGDPVGTEKPVEDEQSGDEQSEEVDELAPPPAAASKPAKPVKPSSHGRNSGGGQ